MQSGRAEKFPYSLSRWTDLPSSKWGWFQDQLEQGWMVGFHPRTGLPGKWSLDPKETFGLIFWTRAPRNLLDNLALVKPFPLVVHFTLTGWSEVEKKAPGIEQGLDLLRELVAAFGPDRVVWRFSPVPVVPDTLERFTQIAEEALKLRLTQVFVSFLQANDRVPETRTVRYRNELLRSMAASAPSLQVRLCNEDRMLDVGRPANLSRGICESGRVFAPQAYIVDLPASEGCGCALAVDPFTINETCTMGCLYCYASDRTSSPKKRNTTRGLPIL